MKAFNFHVFNILSPFKTVNLRPDQGMETYFIAKFFTLMDRAAASQNRKSIPSRLLATRTSEVNFDSNKRVSIFKVYSSFYTAIV